MSKCVDCGAERPSNATKYCNECREKHRMENVTHAVIRYRMRLRGARVCPICGREESENVRFHSTGDKCKDCNVEIRQERDQERAQDKLCADCGTVISKRFGARKRCEECAEKYHKQQQQEWYKNKFKNPG